MTPTELELFDRIVEVSLPAFLCRNPGHSLTRIVSDACDLGRHFIEARRELLDDCPITLPKQDSFP